MYRTCVCERHTARFACANAKQDDFVSGQNLRSSFPFSFNEDDGIHNRFTKTCFDTDSQNRDAHEANFFALSVLDDGCNVENSDALSLTPHSTTDDEPMSPEDSGDSLST